MCVLVAKYFHEFGWCGVKNRDRNYTPSAKFYSDDDSLIFYDNKTNYAEGMNVHKTSILSASLMVRTDEKEIFKKGAKKTKDGEKIIDALKYNSITQSIQATIDSKLTGHTLVFNDEDAYLLEAVNKNKQYFYSLKKLDKNNTLARTNHGIDIHWAGYQFTNTQHSMARISSLARHAASLVLANSANDPIELINNLNYKVSSNPQLNPVRTPLNSMKMKTTSQILQIPKLYKTVFNPLEIELDVNDNINPQFILQLL